MVRRKAIRHIAITICVMALIFIHSAMPADMSSTESGFFVDIIADATGMDSELLSFVVRKTAHFTIFTILGLCLTVNVRDWNVTKGWFFLSHRGQPLKDDANHYIHDVTARNVLLSHVWRVAIPWVIGTVYAVTDEFHQMFVAGRSCELRDVCIDSAGVLAGVLLMTFILRRRISYESK